MTAGEWLYGGFWFAAGAILFVYTVYATLGMGAFLYGFIKGVFSRWY